jgi:hypothetical protein
MAIGSAEPARIPQRAPRENRNKVVTFGRHGVCQGLNRARSRRPVPLVRSMTPSTARISSMDRCWISRVALRLKLSVSRGTGYFALGVMFLEMSEAGDYDVYDVTPL